MSEKTTSTRPKLILIDGHSLAYRAFFASARTQTFSVKHPDGADELTGAVYFFTNMLLKVWKEEQPDYIAVAFDVGKTFRDELFPDYKGTREKMPDELIAQMKRIQQIVSALGVPIFTKENYEADDVLGTLSVRGSTEGMDVIIVTGDRDALQLVNPHIKVLTSGKSFDDTIVYDEARVLERYGVRVDQFIDYKALLGDTSDNVPGVRGIGEKTAQALLQQFGTLDNIYTHLDEVPQKRARCAGNMQRIGLSQPEPGDDPHQCAPGGRLGCLQSRSRLSAHHKSVPRTRIRQHDQAHSGDSARGRSACSCGIRGRWQPVGTVCPFGTAVADRNILWS